MPDAEPDAPGRPRARPDVVFRALAREWVLYDPRSRQLHVLNLTAALVWAHCDGAHDVAAIAESVRGEMAEVPGASAVRRDVEEALGTFAREGLLE